MNCVPLHRLQNNIIWLKYHADALHLLLFNSCLHNSGHSSVFKGQKALWPLNTLSSSPSVFLIIQLIRTFFCSLTSFVNETVQKCFFACWILSCTKQLLWTLHNIYMLSFFRFCLIFKSNIYVLTVFLIRIGDLYASERNFMIKVCFRKLNWNADTFF